MSRPHTPRLLALVALATLAACAQLAPPVPLGAEDHQARIAADRAAIVRDVEPVGARLGLDEAIARALKYNLDRRARMLEQALALQQYDASGHDMLPRLVAAAGYSARDSDRLSRSVDATTGQPLGVDPSVSQERRHTLTQLDLTWNLLDYGLARYNAQQTGDRVLAAAERRRKATHLLVQDVRTAYFRAASAQRLRGEVAAALTLADEAMADARKSEQEKLRSPLDSLRYQRQLTENMRLLESIEQELATARIDLAALINAPVVQQVTLAMDEEPLPLDLLDTPAADMEMQALSQNADLREQRHLRRIAQAEAHKVIHRAYPNVTFTLGANHDTDSYLVNPTWAEVGAQFSFNLFNLLSLPAQKRTAEAAIALADQRRLAAHVAVVAQVHVAREQLGHA
ncbi:MAG: hypothetical protein RLZZ524_1288, partial [Pseudomonadota bacterium]